MSAGENINQIFCYRAKYTYTLNKHRPFHRIQQQNSQMLVFLPKAACSSLVMTAKKIKWKIKIVLSDTIH